MLNNNTESSVYLCHITNTNTTDNAAAFFNVFAIGPKRGRAVMVIPPFGLYGSPSVIRSSLGGCYILS